MINLCRATAASRLGSEPHPEPRLHPASPQLVKPNWRRRRRGSWPWVGADPGTRPTWRKMEGRSHKNRKDFSLRKGTRGKLSGGDKETLSVTPKTDMTGQRASEGQEEAGDRGGGASPAGREPLEGQTLTHAGARREGARGECVRAAQGLGRSRAGAVGTEVAADETARALRQEGLETRDTPAAVSALTTSCEHEEEEPGCREGRPFQGRGGLRVLQRQKAPGDPASHQTATMRSRWESRSRGVGTATHSRWGQAGGKGALPLRAALVAVLRRGGQSSRAASAAPHRAVPHGMRVNSCSADPTARDQGHPAASARSDGARGSRRKLCGGDPVTCGHWTTRGDRRPTGGRCVPRCPESPEGQSEETQGADR